MTNIRSINIRRWYLLMPIVFLLYLGGTPIAWAVYYTTSIGNQLAETSDCDDCSDGPVSFAEGHSFSFFGQSY